MKCYSKSPKLKEVAKNSILIKELAPGNKWRVGSHPKPNKGSFKTGREPWNKNQTKEKDIRLHYKRPTIFKKQDPRIIGANNYNWKGGIIEINKTIRGIPEYLKWRSDIFQRDNWICRTCNNIGCILNAHHIKPFHIILKENNITNIDDARECKELWDIKNGITLCEDCHNLTKTKTLK